MTLRAKSVALPRKDELTWPRFAHVSKERTTATTKMIRMHDRRKLRVRDVMSTPVISVAPHTTVRDIAAQLVKHRISSVPVVGPDGQLFGIVSEADIFKRVELGTVPRRSWWRSLLTDPLAAAENYVRSHGRRARDVMTRASVTSTPDEPLEKLAARMARKSVGCVPVLRNGEVISVITRSDFVRQLAKCSFAQAPLSDKELHRELVTRMASLPWNIHVHLANAEVRGGVASLYGWAGSAIEKRVMEVVAENTPGVVKVRNCVHSVVPYV